MSVELFVGIDVAKDHFDVHLLPTGESAVYDANPSGVASLVTYLKEKSPTLIVLEATGGYETNLAAELNAEGLTVTVVNPRQPRSYAKATGQLAKTDPIDARVLAQFAQAVRPPVRPLASEQDRAIKELVVRRRQLVDFRAMDDSFCSAGCGHSDRRPVASAYRHPGESRGPEDIEQPGFRLPPE